ncbi:MAG: hypothetical protein WCG26_14580 [Chloroflexales bacterium]
MDETTEPASVAVPWQVEWRVARQQVTYLALSVTVVVLAALALGMLAAGMQAGRDEARSVDLALVVTPAVPPESLADHTFELYRRGYAPRVVVTGEGREGLKAQLVTRGVPETQVTLGAEPPGMAALQTITRAVYARGETSLLLVTTPEETLTALKIARDQGLRAYGSPVPGVAPDVLRLALASVHYWQYALSGT